MVSFTTRYIEPGVYVQVEDVLAPSNVAGLLVGAFIGIGSPTKIISKTVTRGGSANGVDSVDVSLTEILSVVDEFGISYIIGTDFIIGTTNTLNASTLSANITATDTSIPVTATTSFSASGYAKVGVEVIKYTSKDATHLLGCTRGYDSLAVSHLSAAAITEVNINGNIDWSPNYNAPTDFPQSKEPSSGTDFSVRYRATKTSVDYDPITFLTEKGVRDFYGNPDDNNDGVVENTLPLGVNLYFQNGGPQQVVTCQMDPTGRDFTIASDRVAAIIEALGKLVAVDCYVVVCLETATASTNTALLAAVKNHVVNESTITERKERIGLLGAPAGTDLNSNPETIYIAAANSLATARMAYLAPSEGTVLLTSGKEVIADGSYLCAALAGIICNPNFTVGEPISGKGLAGFSSVNDPFTRQQKNLMGGNGVLIIEDQDGAFNVRHALSTDPSNIIASELKIQRIKDSLAKTMRTSLGKAFINTRDLGADTLTAIKSFTNLLLAQFIGTRDIVAFRNLSVSKEPTDPRQVNITVEIQPAFDINYILVTLNTTI